MAYPDHFLVYQFFDSDIYIYIYDIYMIYIYIYHIYVNILYMVYPDLIYLIICNIISTYFNIVVLSEVPIFALALGRVAGVSWPGVLARIHGDFGI
jgi:hypothetical protein